MAVDCYPVQCISGVFWVNVCDRRCPGVIGTLAVRGIWITARGQHRGFIDGLNYNSKAREIGPIWKGHRGVKKKKKKANPIHYFLEKAK